MIWAVVLAGGLALLGAALRLAYMKGRKDAESKASREAAEKARAFAEIAADPAASPDDILRRMRNEGM